MRTNYRVPQWLALLALLSTINHPLSTLHAQGTAFNYQGRLNDAGNPANGSYDLRFTVYDALTSGNAVSGVLTNAATPVASGLFSVMLDFGSGVFTGPERWLQVDVRTNGGGAFTALTPRQQVMPLPYAVMANTASNLLGTMSAGQLSGTVPLTRLPPAVVTNGAAGLTLIGNFGGTFSGYGAGLAGISGSSIQNGTIGSAQLAAGAVTAANLAPGIGAVPSGTIVLSPTATNAALTAAGFAPALTGWGTAWTQATNAAPWSARSGFGALAFNGQMWVLGGRALDNTVTNDVWSSSNGVTWTCVTNAAPWSGRTGLGTFAFNGQIWVMGGEDSGSFTFTNDVWASSNGVDWTKVTSAAPWSARFNFGALAFNGQMWVMGGMLSSGFTNDVWSSSNGVDWTQVTSAAPWSARGLFGAVAFNGKMWMMGGSVPDLYAGTNDVWSSSDGVAWTKVTSAAPWSARSDFGALAFNNQMWVLGGTGANDVWSSSEGVAWTQVTSAAPWGGASWSGRFGFGVLTFNGQTWLVGGNLGFMGTFIPWNDVWLSQNTTNNTLGGLFLFQKQ